MNEMGVSDIYTFAELNYLRMEAMDLFERCLTEGDSKPLEAFVHAQISQEPPRLELLREVAEDLHQRLLELHTNHYAMREQLMAVLCHEFGIEARELLPFNMLKADQQLSLDDVLEYVQQQNPLATHSEMLLRRKIDDLVKLEGQLHRDIDLTRYLYSYVMDWVMGLNAIFTQRFWAATRYAPFSTWEQ